MSSDRKVKDWIDGYMKFDAKSEPPDSYKRWTAISTLAGALQRKVRIDWGPITWYPNMYIVLVGPPGKAKKGTAMDPGRRFLSDLEVPLAAESITREALIRTMSEISTSIIDKETKVPSFHSSLTVFSGELVVFLGSQNYTMISDLTDWFDCADRWQYRTKNQGTDHIQGLFFNLIGGTTPDLIRTALPLDAIGGGLTSRMIFVFEPDRGRLCPVPNYSQEQINMRKDLMTDLERIHNLQGTFKVTEKFIEAWTPWYIDAAQNPVFDDKRFSGYIERRPMHVMKLCMILSASRSDSLIITDKDFRRAVSIMQDTEVKMPQAFSGVGKERNNDVVAAIMEEIGIREEVLWRDLLGMFLQDIDGFQFDNIITTLSTINYIDLQRMPDLGNSVIKYRGESTASINNAIRASKEGK